MGRESGDLLIGEHTNRAVIRRVKKIIKEDPAVEEVGDILTMQLGPNQVLLTVDMAGTCDEASRPGAQF